MLPSVQLLMLHTVVVDAQALAALDILFTRCGTKLPHSSVVDRRLGLAWHAIPIDADTITAIQLLRRSADEPFNDTLRTMLDLPPLQSAGGAAEVAANPARRAHASRLPTPAFRVAAR